MSPEFADELDYYNGTILMWLTQSVEKPEPLDVVYDYYNQFLPDNYAGFYIEGDPAQKFYRPDLLSVGLLNLVTGKLEFYSGNPPRPDRILIRAWEINLGEQQ